MPKILRNLHWSNNCTYNLPNHILGRVRQAPIAILRSDGTVYTFEKYPKPSRWSVVSGWTTFKRRLVDVAVSGGGFRCIAERGQLLLVSMEGHVQVMYGAHLLTFTRHGIQFRSTLSQ